MPLPTWTRHPKKKRNTKNKNEHQNETFERNSCAIGQHGEAPRPPTAGFAPGPGRAGRSGTGRSLGPAPLRAGFAVLAARPHHNYDFLLEMLRDGISRPGPVPEQVRLGRVTARPGFGMSVHPETAPSGAVSHRRRAAAPPRPCGRRRCRRQYRGPRQAKTQRAATRCAPMQGPSEGPAPASLENRRWRLGSHLASAVCKKADGEERALAASGSVTAGWFYVSKIMPLLLPFAIMSGFRPYF